MSVNNQETYSLITEILSKTPELENPIQLLQEISRREDEFCKTQEEIRTLYDDCQKDNLCPYYKEVAKDMITNITDGRFEEFYRGKPKFLDSVEADISETMKHVEIAKKELENMPSKEPVDKDALVRMITEVNKQRSGIVRGDIYDKCIGSLEKFKSNFEHVDVNEDLVKNSTRDSVFEEDMKKIISSVKDFQQVIEARKTINTLSHQQEAALNPSEQLATPPLHTDVISNLLKDVERVNYTELNH